MKTLEEGDCGKAHDIDARVDEAVTRLYATIAEGYATNDKCEAEKAFANIVVVLALTKVYERGLVQAGLKDVLVAAEAHAERLTGAALTALSKAIDVAQKTVRA